MDLFLRVSGGAAPCARKRGGRRPGSPTHAATSAEYSSRATSAESSSCASHVIRSRATYHTTANIIDT
eukprot:5439166-Pyramimonas_sp.AAC.2